jgi:isoleucyl-tRNA synthetase
MADAYRRIRNTARFLLANIADFDPAEHSVPFENMLTLDRWLLSHAADLQRELVRAYDSFEFHQIYQKLHGFCAVELSSFYLDVIKDRQYTMKTNSLARRSAQTALYHVLEALVRWIAPVLSFTADEIWAYVPGRRSESVFTEAWYPLAYTTANDPYSPAFWEKLLAVRVSVAKQLEKLRVAGGIGSSLDAEVDLYCDAELLGSLRLLDDELRFVFITSYARVHPAAAAPEHAAETEIPGLKIAVAPSAFAKCGRCWHHREDVGQSVEHPILCGRCVRNVAGDGEVRRYA